MLQGPVRQSLNLLFLFLRFEHPFEAQPFQCRRKVVCLFDVGKHLVQQLPLTDVLSAIVLRVVTLNEVGRTV